MATLTKRQNEVFEYLQLFSKENSYWPSIREVARHFGFKSTNAVMNHVKALEQKGFISHSHGQARAYRINNGNGNGNGSAPKPVNAIDVVDIPIYGSIAAGYPDGVETGGEIGRLQIDVDTAGIRKTRNTKSSTSWSKVSA